MTFNNRRKKILVSGFTTFSDHQSNPSREVLGLLESNLLEIESIVLPVTYKSSYSTLQNAISKSEPDFILMLGLAYSRNQICLEKVAINLADADLADNDGKKKLDEIIDPRGQAAIFSSLPLREWQNMINSPKLSISHSAGSYVCNFLYYLCLLNNPAIPSLFVHLPPKDTETSQGMTLSAQARLLNSLLSQIATHLVR